MKANNENKSLCPSYNASTDAKLLGIRNREGKIMLLPAPLEVDKAFASHLPDGAVPEQYFRFTGNCKEHHCKQWTKKGCGVALRAVHYLNSIVGDEELPVCSIRKNCRWHQQEGPGICKICPYIITDITAAEIKTHFDNKNHSDLL